MDSISTHVQIRLVGDTVVARLHDVQALYEHAVILEIGDQLYNLVGRPGVRRLIVNLEAVEYAATEMIAKLVSLNRRAEQAGMPLTLCGLGPVLASTLHGLRIDGLFDIKPTEADALGPPEPASLHDTQELPRMG